MCDHRSTCHTKCFYTIIHLKRLSLKFFFFLFCLSRMMSEDEIVAAALIIIVVSKQKINLMRKESTGVKTPVWNNAVCRLKRKGIIRPREVTSEFPVAQKIETHAANFHYSLFIILYYIIFCLSYRCIAGKSIISTRMYTDHHSNTLSAATILSPLFAMLGEKQNSPWIQDFLLCEFMIDIFLQPAWLAIWFRQSDRKKSSVENLQSTARNPDLEIFTFVSLASFDLK